MGIRALLSAIPQSFTNLSYTMIYDRMQTAMYYQWLSVTIITVCTCV